VFTKCVGILPEIIFLNLYKDTIMTAAMKRDRLITYLADVNDKKVSALYSILEKEINDIEPALTEEQLEIINERRADMLSGKNIRTDWQKMHDEIRAERKPAK